MLADRIDAAVRARAPPPCCASRCPGIRGRSWRRLEYAQEAGPDRRHRRRHRLRPGRPPHDLLLPAAVGTGLAFDTACAPMLLGRVLLEAMCDALPDAQARLEEFDARAAARGLFVE